MPMKIAISLVVMAMSTLAQNTADDHSFAVVALCDLLGNPSAYNGRFVTLRGVYDNALRPETVCPQKFTTAGHIWPQAVELCGPLDSEGRPLNNAIIKAYSFDDFVASTRSTQNRREVTIATFIGQLVTRTKYTVVNTQYGTLGNGFCSGSAENGERAFSVSVDSALRAGIFKAWGSISSIDVWRARKESFRAR